MYFCGSKKMDYLIAAGTIDLVKSIQRFFCFKTGLMMILLIMFCPSLISFSGQELQSFV